MINMIHMEAWELAILLIAALVCGYLAGERRGKQKAEAPSAAGFIDFVKMEDGHEQCVFKLQDDVDWIAKQEYIIFQVRHEEAVTELGL